MSKKVHILFLVLIFGFFLIPTVGFACGKSSEKISCQRKITTQTTSDSCKKDCCKKDLNAKREQHGCNGKCDHTGCTTSLLQFSLISENQFNFNNNLFNFSSDKQISLHKIARISAGFTSIWLIPKIN